MTMTTADLLNRIHQEIRRPGSHITAEADVLPLAGVGPLIDVEFDDFDNRVLLVFAPRKVVVIE